jgi:hypothetical protein
MRESMGAGQLAHPTHDELAMMQLKGRNYHVFNTAKRRLDLFRLKLKVHKLLRLLRETPLRVQD